MAAPNNSALGYGYPMGRAIRFGRSGVGDPWASAGAASMGSVHLCDAIERDGEELRLDGRTVQL